MSKMKRFIEDNFHLEDEMWICPIDDVRCIWYDGERLIEVFTSLRGERRYNVDLEYVIMLIDRKELW